MWLLDNLRPGHKTISDYRKDNRESIRQGISLSGVNKQVKKLEAELDKYLTQLQNNDIVEDLEEQLGSLSEEFEVEPAL